MAERVSLLRLLLGAALVAALVAPVAGAGVPATKTGGPAPRRGLVGRDGPPLRRPALRGEGGGGGGGAAGRAPPGPQAPLFVALQEKYRDRGLVVVGVSLDESPEPVRKFRKELGVNYRLALGDEKVAERWGGVLGLPVAFVVDRAGRRRARREGEHDLSALERDVVRLLAEK